MALNLKLTPSPTFTATVEIPVPGDAPALPPLSVTWRHKGRKALLEWTRQGMAGRSDVDILDEVIVSWDDECVGVLYSREALAQIFDDFPAASVAFAEAYRSALLEARTKN